jgi:hypothetical protein
MGTRSSFRSGRGRKADTAVKDLQQLLSCEDYGGTFLNLKEKPPLLPQTATAFISPQPMPTAITGKFSCARLINACRHRAGQ